MSAYETRNSSISNSSVKGALKSVARRYKEHHEATQAAWEAYYGLHPSPAATRRPSAESTSSTEAAPARPTNLSKAWTAIKKHAAEHHASVEGAHAAYYGRA